MNMNSLNKTNLNNDLFLLINNVQDTLLNLNLDNECCLPQIAVVGDQSSGKSSVLEKFVGIEFLPRGFGIVTKLPLILQLNNVQTGKDHGKFLHIPRKIFYNFSEIRNEIMLETERQIGNTKNISPHPIKLQIYSKNVLNLILVDLPGLTKVPVEGQPIDIANQIQELVMSYIGNPNCIILAIIAATSDLANSAALKMALEVDPGRSRTIGVITKIDMMDPTQDCVKILKNEEYRLKLGYIGVVNNSQSGINSEESFNNAKSEEMNFFMSHEKYKLMVDLLGTEYLQRTLHDILSQYMRRDLQKLQGRIAENIATTEKQIRYTIDDDCVSNPIENASKILMTKIQELSRRLDMALGYINEDIQFETLSFGTKISELLHIRLANEFKLVQPSTQSLRIDISIALLNSHGVKQEFFIGRASYLSIINKLILNLINPCIKIMNLTAKEVVLMVKDILADLFNRYPKIQKEIQYFLNTKIERSLRNTDEKIRFFIKIQADHINNAGPNMYQIIPIHEDLITQTMNNKEYSTIKHGTLMVNDPIRLKGREYFCLIKNSHLTMYENENMKEIKDIASLKDCTLQYIGGFKTRIILQGKDGSMITKSQSALHLSFKNVTDADIWVRSFMEVGVKCPFYEKENSKYEEIIKNQNPDIIKQIEFIYFMVKTYMKNTITNILDLIPKIIVLSIINSLRDSITTELVIQMYSLGNIQNLMTESDTARNENQTLKNKLRNLKSTLHKMDIFIQQTKTPQKFTLGTTTMEKRTKQLEPKSYIPSPIPLKKLMNLPPHRRDKSILK